MERDLGAEQVPDLDRPVETRLRVSLARQAGMVTRTSVPYTGHSRDTAVWLPFAGRCGRIRRVLGAKGSSRYGWLAGIVFVVVLAVESGVSVGVAANQDDSPAKIAAELHVHEDRLILIACLSVVFAAAFLAYLARLHALLSETDRGGALRALVPAGGALFIALHAVSDIGITGMLGAKLASYSAAHDPGISYTLYLTTFALDSVADVFGSLFLLAAGILALRSGLLPRWLAWVAIVAAGTFVVQGFGLGGVIATFGLVVDLVGFLLLLIFVLASSIVGLARPQAPCAAEEVPHQPGRAAAIRPRR